MPMHVDPRAWNLLAGLSLATGACSGRTIGGDGTAGDGGTSEADGGTSQSSTDTSSTDSEGDDPECNQDSDCPPGYYCIDQYCEYQIAPDGSTWYECYELSGCGTLALCLYNYCEPVPGLSDCAPGDEASIPLTVYDAPLALRFVDLDADGAQELAVATQTELHVFESGSNVAIVGARVFESPSVTAMVAGDFEPGAGQDLALLVDDTLLIHPSDGIAGFDAPSESPSPQLDSTGMLAGDFDGVPPSDRLIWGSSGASVLTGGVSMLHDGPVEAATVRDLSDSAPRFVLQQPDLLRFYGLDGAILVDAPSYPSSVVAPLISFDADLEQFELDATVFNWVDGPWTMLELWTLAQPQARWGVVGTIAAMVGGDLDGDGNDEVALLLDDAVKLLDGPASGNECTQPLDSGGPIGATHLAVGDWDGDGDDELAVAFATGELAVFDGEG